MNQLENCFHSENHSGRCVNLPKSDLTPHIACVTQMNNLDWLYDPRSNVTLAPRILAGSGALTSWSMRTASVKYSAGPLLEGCDSLLLMSMFANPTPLLPFVPLVLSNFLIETHSLPSSLAATIAALPSMSLFPKAPFGVFTCPSMLLAAPRLRSRRPFYIPFLESADRSVDLFIESTLKLRHQAYFFDWNWKTG
jgi:hypothetical protein